MKEMDDVDAVVTLEPVAVTVDLTPPPALVGEDMMMTRIGTTLPSAEEVAAAEEAEMRERVMITRKAIAATAASKAVHRKQVKLAASKAAALGAQRVQKGFCAQQVALLRASLQQQQISPTSSSSSGTESYPFSLSPTSDDGIIYGESHVSTSSPHHRWVEEEEEEEHVAEDLQPQQGEGSTPETARKLYSYLSHDLSHLRKVPHTVDGHNDSDVAAAFAAKRDSLTLFAGKDAAQPRIQLSGVEVGRSPGRRSSYLTPSAPFCVIDAQGRLKCGSSNTLNVLTGGTNLIDSLDLAVLVDHQDGGICHRGPDGRAHCVRSVHLEADELLELSSSAAGAAAGTTTVVPGIEAM